MANLSSSKVFGDLSITGSLKIKNGKLTIDNTAVTITASELNMLSGLESNAQAQLSVLQGLGTRQGLGTLNQVSFAGVTSTFTGNLTGNSSTATKLLTTRAISLTGDATGSGNFDGSANLAITVTVTDNSHNHIASNISDFDTEVSNNSSVSANTAKVGITTTQAANITTNTNTLPLKADQTTTYTKTENDVITNALSDEIINHTANYNTTDFTAIDAQTTFASDYTVGYVDVYRNGIKLAKSEFIASNGTSIVLLIGAEVNDVVQIVSLKSSFLLADAYSQAQVDVIASLKADKLTTYTKTENDGITDGIVSAQAIVNTGKADKATTSVSVIASKTLILTDSSTLQICNSASLITVTIPTNVTVAFPIGTEIVITRYGVGAVTVAGSVTIQSSYGMKSINPQYGAVSLNKVGTDEWLLIGALSE